jgi:hypothetical protein
VDQHSLHQQGGIQICWGEGTHEVFLVGYIPQEEYILLHDYQQPVTSRFYLLLYTFIYNYTDIILWSDFSIKYMVKL